MRIIILIWIAMTLGAANAYECQRELASTIHSVAHDESLATAFQREAIQWMRQDPKRLDLLEHNSFLRDDTLLLAGLLMPSSGQGAKASEALATLRADILHSTNVPGSLVSSVNSESFKGLPSVREYLRLRNEIDPTNEVDFLQPLAPYQILEDARTHQTTILIPGFNRDLPIRTVDPKFGLYHWANKADRWRDGLKEEHLAHWMFYGNDSLLGGGLYVSADPLDSRFFGKVLTKFTTSRPLKVVDGVESDPWPSFAARLALRSAGIDGITQDKFPDFKHLSWINLVSIDSIACTEFPDIAEIKNSFWNLGGYLMAGRKTAGGFQDPEEYQTILGHNFFDLWTEQEVVSLLNRWHPDGILQVLPDHPWDNWNWSTIVNVSQTGGLRTKEMTIREALDLRLKQIRKKSPSSANTPLFKVLQQMLDGRVPPN